MVPYIAALIVLIVAVLFAVYKRVDTFEIVSTTFKGTDSLSKVITYLQKLLTRNDALLSRLESASDFNEKATEAVMKDLSILPTSQGETISDLLQHESNQFKELFAGVITQFNKLNPSMKLQELVEKPEDLTQFLVNLDGLDITLKKRETYLDSKLGPAKIAGVDAEDLYGAVGGTQEAIEASSVEDVDVTTSRQKHTSQKDIAPSASPALTKEVEKRIANTVVTQLKDTLLSQRSTNNLMEDTSCPYASYESNGTAQGKEYQHVKPIQPAPDMSEYIRKDSIPCWNCSLP